MDINDFQIQLGIPAPAKEPQSINEMRQAINRASRDCSVIRQALNCQYYAGLSGEDMYVQLAYVALRRLNVYYKTTLRWYSLATPLPVVVDKDQTPV